MTIVSDLESVVGVRQRDPGLRRRRVPEHDLRGGGPSGRARRAAARHRVRGQPDSAGHLYHLTICIINSTYSSGQSDQSKKRSCGFSMSCNNLNKI